MFYSCVIMHDEKHHHKNEVERHPIWTDKIDNTTSISIAQPWTHPMLISCQWTWTHRIDIPWCIQGHQIHSPLHHMLRSILSIVWSSPCRRKRETNSSPPVSDRQLLVALGGRPIQRSGLCDIEMTIPYNPEAFHPKRKFIWCEKHHENWKESRSKNILSIWNLPFIWFQKTSYRILREANLSCSVMMHPCSAGCTIHVPLKDNIIYKY